MVAWVRLCVRVNGDGSRLAGEAGDARQHLVPARTREAGKGISFKASRGRVGPESFPFPSNSSLLGEELRSASLEDGFAFFFECAAALLVVFAAEGGVAEFLKFAGIFRGKRMKALIAIEDGF